MEYTVYHLYEKAHNIGLPSQQLLLVTSSVSSLEHWPLLKVLTFTFEIISIDCLIV